VRTQIKEHTYLGPDARFVTEPEYPEFAWKEIIVNAIAHRDYSIKGTDIQIKMFDDHITVESPGTLPGTVRLNNMREIHFSRNPKMAQLLHEYEYVREFGEGVDRMYREMEEAGLPEPEYKTVAFMVHATIKNKKYLVDAVSTGLMHQEQPKSAEDVPKSAEDVILEGQQLVIYEYVLTNKSITTVIACEVLGVKERRARSVLADMCKMGYLKKQGATSNLKYILARE